MNQGLAHDVGRMREEVRQALGVERVEKLHSPVRWLDWAMLLGSPALFVALALALGRLPRGLPWLACLVAQGFALQWLFMVAHDLVFHRGFPSPRARSVLGFLMLLPLLIPYSVFAAVHQRHHEETGTERDAEAYKQDLDRTWKRLLFLTFPGMQLAVFRKLRAKGLPRDRVSVPDLTRADRARIRKERRFIQVFSILMVIGSFFSPVLRLGYLFPLLVTYPIVSAVRIALEHGEADLTRFFHIGIHYPGNLLTRALYLWHIGDSHILHHVYPTMPIYGVSRGVTRFTELLDRHQLPKRSLLQGIAGFVILNRPHRMPWGDTSVKLFPSKNGLDTRPSWRNGS